MSEDQFYGQLDNIMMWCFTLGFNAARREHGEPFASATEAESLYEDHLDSWIEDIMTSHKGIVENAIELIWYETAEGCNGERPPGERGERELDTAKQKVLKELHKGRNDQ